MMDHDQDLVVVTRYHDVIRVAWADGSPLPTEIYDDLTRTMTYTHLVYKRGQEKAHAIRNKLPLRTHTRVNLYHYDSQQCLVCMAGFATHVLSYFREMQVPLEYRLTGRWADLPRPDCFTEDWSFVDKNFEFRPYQREVVRSILDQCHARLGGTIQAAPGFGKTAVFKVVSRVFPRARIGIVVRGTPLVSRTADDIQEYVPRVGQVRTGRREIERVTVYSADSLQYMASDIDLLLCDEVHEMATTKYFRLFGQYAAVPLRFGFSANVDDRPDGASRALEGMFGPKLHDLSMQDVTATGSIVPIKVIWNRYHTDVEVGGIMDETVKKRVGLWTHPARNQCIAARARSYDPDMQVLIMCRTAEHVVHLHKLLPEYTMVFSKMDAKDVADYQRQGLLPEDFVPPNAKELDELRRRFEAGELKHAISTTIWRQGISPNQLSVLIWAMAGSSKIDSTQGPTRAVRRHDASNKTCAIVEDFDDQFDYGLSRQAAQRYKHYENHGWQQIVSSECYSIT